MRPDFNSLFSRLEPVEPPSGLEQNIINRVRLEARAAVVRRRLWSGSLGLAVTGPLAFFAVRALGADLVQTGASDFFSLLLTDADLVLRYAGEFAATVLESLPTTSLAAALATAAAVALSVGTLIAGLRGFLAQHRPSHYFFA